MDKNVQEGSTHGGRARFARDLITLLALGVSWHSQGVVSWTSCGVILHCPDVAELKKAPHFLNIGKAAF